MNTCESYFISEVKSQLTFLSENVTEEDSIVDISGAKNHLWNTKENTTKCMPLCDDAVLNQINNKTSSSVICEETLANNPTNERTNLVTDKTGKEDSIMSASTSITNEENTTDNINDLLSMTVSKDYINCVWSTEPQNSNTSDAPKDQEKLADTNAVVESGKANFNSPFDEEQHKKQQQKVADYLSILKPRKKLKKLSTVEKNLFVAFKDLVVKRTLPLYEPQHYDSRFFNGLYFNCKGCGDRFVLETSFTCHMKRKTSKFSYKCPVCKTQLLFDNRCSLLVHIMSHGMTANSLQPEELRCLPLSDDESECDALFKHTSSISFKCPECSTLISSLKLHFQGIENEVSNVDLSLICEECTYILPTNCSLRAHERFHKMKPPHLCPDCGEVFLSASLLYSHMEEKCLHHLKCSMFKCDDCMYEVANIHSFSEHIVSNHSQKFFVCHICGDKVDSLEEFNKHRLNKHKMTGVSQYSEIAGLCARVRCDKCPDLTMDLDLLLHHAVNHASDPKFTKTVYKCKSCKLIFSSRTLLLSHKTNCKSDNEIPLISEQELTENVISSVPVVVREVSDSDKKLKPLLSSENSWVDNEIESSENNCELTASKRVNGSQHVIVSEGGLSQTLQNPGKEAICKLCKKVVSVGVDKAALKEHFSTQHVDIFLNAVHQEGNYRLSLQTVSTRTKEAVSEKDKKAVENFLKCMKNNDFTTSDMKVAVKKKKAQKSFNVRKSSLKDVGRSSQLKVSRFECYKCLLKSEDPVSFNTHILSHKSNPSDLQCPECGLCFIVRPPLEKHLIVGHGIRNVKKYLIDQGFQDRTSEGEEEPVDVETIDTEELEENQCTVCRQKFENALMLQKHFRVHGGAFLLAKLKAKKSNS